MKTVIIKDIKKIKTYILYFIKAFVKSYILELQDKLKHGYTYDLLNE